MRKIKIIYSGIEAENYNPARKFSFEYNNFYLTLKNMPEVEVIEYPYDTILAVGRRKFNQELLALVKKEKPDLFFAFMFTDELDPKILDEIKKTTTSIAWFADDHWRLHNYSRFYALYFTWGITTWSRASEVYAAYGIKNIIRSQWASNPLLWKPAGPKKKIEVSFVGQRTAKRAEVLDKLRQAGIRIYLRGFGWPGGRVSDEELLDVFSSSKINLNLNDAPGRINIRSLGRIFLGRSIDKIVPSFDIVNNIKSWSALRRPQIKARTFELAACRAFVISGYADDISRYYKENEEMIFYRNEAELAEKIKYYLSRDNEREKIAEAAYKRTLRDHTYEKRFREIFKIVGLGH